MVLLRACALLLTAGLLVGCGDGDDDRGSTYGAGDASTPAERPTDTPPTPTSDEEPSPPPGAELVARGSDFGTMLFDDRGQAIYLFDVEKGDEPRCYGACAEAWPPVLTEGAPLAGDGLDQRLVSTTERRDGSMQVTYGGHPLYLYAHEARGEVKCHDVFLNGGNWYVVQPDGKPAPPG